MARPPLIHFPGALFHVTARGNNKQIIFHSDKDFSRYLQNIQKCKKQIPFFLYAFALMPNHIHLLIEVAKAPISKIMQKLQTAYTMYMNKKYDRVGHIFQGRYFSLLVEKETHLLELIRYIHLNPARAGIAPELGDYRWTSHGVYLDTDQKRANIVNTEKVLPYFSSDPKKALANYQEFIIAGLGKKWEDIAGDVKRGQILGSSKFVQQVERKLPKLG